MHGVDTLLILSQWRWAPCFPVAVVAQGELPDTSHRQGEEALPKSDEGRGCGGDVVRIRRDAAQMVREPLVSVMLLGSLFKYIKYIMWSAKFGLVKAPVICVT